LPVAGDRPSLNRKLLSIRVGRDGEAKRTRCVDIAAAKEAQLGGIPWGLEERLRDRERVVMEVSKGIMVLPEQTK
jgi:hypothetical protein